MYVRRGWLVGLPLVFVALATPWALDGSSTAPPLRAVAPPSDNWPSPSRFTIEEPDQVKMPDDFLQRPTMAAVTGAIKLLRHRYPDVAIVGLPDDHAAWTAFGNFSTSVIGRPSL